MLVEERRVMRGPNMWSDEHPNLIVLKIGFGAYPEQAIRECIEKSRMHIPGTANAIASEAKDPKLIFTRLMASLGTALQEAEIPLFQKAFRKGEVSFYAVFEYQYEGHGMLAGQKCEEIMEQLLQGAAFPDLHKTCLEIHQLAGEEYLGPSTEAIVNAARKRGIPSKNLPGGLIALGYGKYQKRVSASIGENTSNIGVEVAGDKDLTKKLLEAALIPVPKGELVTEEQSLKAVSERLGFPLVTKPYNGHQGQGITSGINDLETLITAFRTAATFSTSVIVEKYITGNDFRFLVIGYKLLAVAKRSPASVTGDGLHNIQQLVDEVNTDPRRGDGHSNLLTKIMIDEHSLQLLRARGLTVQSVPAKGEQICLKGTANLSTGGTAEDVTDAVHPLNVLLAERVASIVGLDICGIDIMAPSVTEPIAENGGAVLEVNAAPGLRMHIAPSSGSSRNVGDPIVDLLYPAGANSRVPIVAVTGTNGKTTTCRLTAFIAQQCGYQVGLTSTDGIYLNDTCIYNGDCSGPQSGEVVLHEPLVDFAVLECARGGIIRSGLAFDTCDIAIVTNVAEDHLGLKDIYTVEDLAAVKSVVPKSVSKNGYAVLNAADDLVYAMKDKVKCKLAFFATDRNNPRLISHCKAGGTCCAVNADGNIVILSGENSTVVENVKNIPLTINGTASFMIENVIACVLASHLLGFPIDVLRSALVNFKPSADQTPGRLNFFEVNKRNVIIDYAHNPHGFKAIGKMLNHIRNKKIGIVTGVGDRRDEDIMLVGTMAAGMYDEIVIRIDDDTRGRTAESIASLIIAGIKSKNNKIPYCIIPDTKNALFYALGKAEQGDYIIICADKVSETIDLVRELSLEPQES